VANGGNLLRVVVWRKVIIYGLLSVENGNLLWLIVW